MDLKISGLDLSKIPNLLNIGSDSSGQGASVENTEGGSTSWLSKMGESDSVVISKIGTDLTNLQSGINEKLTEFKESSFLANAQENITNMAKGITAMGIPDKIRDAVRGFREKIVDSGIIGNVAQKVLDLVYSVGSKLPVIGPIVSAISTVLPGSSVQTVINNTLRQIEENFFDPLEDEDSNYQKMRKEILQAISVENITETSIGLFNTALNAGIEATREGASFDTVVDVIKTSIDKEIKSNEEIEKLSDAKPYVGGALSEIGSGIVNSVVGIASDEGIQGAVETAITNAPNLIDGVMQSVSEASSYAQKFAGAASSLSGNLSGLTGSLGNIGNLASTLTGSFSSLSGGISGLSSMASSFTGVASSLVGIGKNLFSKIL